MSKPPVRNGIGFFLYFLLLFPVIALAAPALIGNTYHQITAPKGWNQTTNPQTGTLQFVSPDGLAIIDLNPAEDGPGLDGKSLLDGKATATENILNQNGIKLSLTHSQFESKDGGSYLFKTYETTIEDQEYIMIMAFIYSGKHSFLANSAIQKQTKALHLDQIKKSMLSLTRVGTAQPASLAQSSSTASVSTTNASSKIAFKVVEDWTTGYSYSFPANWIGSPISKATDPFNTQISPARMVSGHISRMDRMRTYFRKNLEEAHEYFLKNNMSKGKVTQKRDLIIGGRPARILDVEYDYPMQISKARLILIECEEFVYQFFLKAPSSYKSNPDPETGTGYWENNIEPVMVEIEKTFKPMRSGTVPGLTPHKGRVLCQSNNADLKFELPASWISSQDKVVNGRVNLGVSSGVNFGGDGISLRFDSYSRGKDSEYADIDTATQKWQKRVSENPQREGVLVSSADYVLNGIKARRLKIVHDLGKTGYRRWVILAETPNKIVVFNMSGSEGGGAKKERSFKNAGEHAAIHLMRTLSSTRKGLFGSAVTKGL